MKHKEPRGTGEGVRRPVQKKGILSSEEESSEEEERTAEERMPEAEDAKCEGNETVGETRAHNVLCGRAWCKLGRGLNIELKKQVTKLHQKIARREEERDEAKERERDTRRNMKTQVEGQAREIKQLSERGAASEDEGRRRALQQLAEGEGEAGDEADGGGAIIDWERILDGGKERQMAGSSRFYMDECRVSMSLATGICRELADRVTRW